MAKKLLCVIVLMLALVCALALTACNSESSSESSSTNDKEQEEESENNHIHSFGEWSVTKEATTTEKGTQTRFCICGETQTKDIPIKVPQTQTSQLSLLEFCNEFEAYYEATKNQPSFSLVERDIYEGDPFTYCTIYFDGEQTLIQYNAHDTHIFGKVGLEYVDINITQKTYTTMSESNFNDLVNIYRRNMLDTLEYFPDEIKKGTNFECQKLTNDNKITYFVKCSVEYGGVFGTVNYRTTIKVENGVIIEYEDPELEEIILTYPNDVVVELPNISDYTRE